MLKKPQFFLFLKVSISKIIVFLINVDSHGVRNFLAFSVSLNNKWLEVILRHWNQAKNDKLMCRSF